MAKQSMGYLGGFSGRLGPVIGYMWNGKWCMRAHNAFVSNPRTAAQMAHRTLFKHEVQTAAAMRWAVTTCLTDEARHLGMTSYNLFVHLNQQAFSMVDGQFKVDYSRLLLSVGDVRPVEVGDISYTADNVLTVKFGKNGGAAHDSVYLYVYSPELGEGYLAAPVYRLSKCISVSLPDEYAGREVHLYAMVQNGRGEWSLSVYAGCITLDENELPATATLLATSEPGTTAQEKKLTDDNLCVPLQHEKHDTPPWP